MWDGQIAFVQKFYGRAASYRPWFSRVSRVRTLPLWTGAKKTDDDDDRRTKRLKTAKIAYVYGFARHDDDDDENSVVEMRRSARE